MTTPETTAPTEPQASTLFFSNVTRPFPEMTPIATDVDVNVNVNVNRTPPPNGGHYRGAHVDAPWGAKPARDVRSVQADSGIPEKYRTFPGKIPVRDVARAYPNHVKFGNIYVDRIREGDCSGCM